MAIWQISSATLEIQTIAHWGRTYVGTCQIFSTRGSTSKPYLCLLFQRLFIQNCRGLRSIFFHRFLLASWTEDWGGRWWQKSLLCSLFWSVWSVLWSRARWGMNTDDGGGEPLEADGAVGRSWTHFFDFRTLSWFVLKPGFISNASWFVSRYFLIIWVARPSKRELYKFS